MTLRQEITSLSDKLLGWRDIGTAPKDGHMVSPEERAQALSDDLLDRGKVPILTHEARAIIASAIRAAENEALERAADAGPAYRIAKPKDGFRAIASFTEDEKAKLRPVAETLAMLDGNAFFGNEAGEGQDWYEMYLPEAAAIYDANGGDSGWAGEASFARALNPKEP